MGCLRSLLVGGGRISVVFEPPGILILRFAGYGGSSCERAQDLKSQPASRTTFAQLIHNCEYPNMVELNHAYLFGIFKNKLTIRAFPSRFRVDGRGHFELKQAKSRAEKSPSPGGGLTELEKSFGYQTK